jgi:hypothetical protein
MLNYVHSDIVKSLNISSRARNCPDFLIKDGNTLKLLCGVVVSLQKPERLSTLAEKMPRFARQCTISQTDACVFPHKADSVGFLADKVAPRQVFH